MNPPGWRTYGRCQCRCECMATAVVKVRTWRGGLIRRWCRSRWVNVCTGCLPHLADQVEELGKIWHP